MFRPIYGTRGRAQEYCDFALNIYDGCTNGCSYCYAPKVLRKSPIEFIKGAKPRHNIVNATYRQIEKDQVVGKKIMLCFTCDPYPAGIDTTTTRKIIQALKETGNSVQILSKSGMAATRDLDLLDENDSFGVTVTGGNFGDQLNPMESNTADEHERLASLRVAHDKGIKTWVSCEPVLNPEGVYFAITNCSFIDMYRIGKMNYLPSSINWHEFGHECRRLCLKYRRNFYIKEDLRAAMAAQGGV